MSQNNLTFQTLQELKEEGLKGLCDVSDLEAIASWRTKYLGRSGKLTVLLRGIGTLPEHQRKSVGAMANRVRVELQWIESEMFEQPDAVQRLEGVDGILVPGGFGERGSEGKIAAATFARTKNVPYFGICFGMQMAVIEAARNLAGLNGASSTEFGSCLDPVVGLMTEWTEGDFLQTRGTEDDKGGTMRLGQYDCHLSAGSKVNKVYANGADEGTSQGVMISERHRHRYEVNINYREKLEAVGLRFSGLSPDGNLPEIVELEGHPWFIGVQFHPELKSKPFEPPPLFASFIAAAIDQMRLV